MKFSPNAEPVAWSAALVAVLNALVLLGVITLDADQIAALNVAFTAVLGVVVRQKVSPV